MNRQRLAWFSPHPTHYNNFLFEQLNESLPIHLELFFFNKVLTNYPWKKEISSLPFYVLKKRFGVDWGLLFRIIFSKKTSFDAVVIAGWSEPSMLLLLSYLRLFKKRYILYTDTPNENRKQNVKQYLRRKWLSWILSGSKAVLVTGERGVKIMERWGAPMDCTYNFPFATDLNFYKPASSFPRSLGKALQIFSSGRLDIHHKGYDVALRALALLKEHRPAALFHYTIAGTGPDEAVIRKLVTDLSLIEEVQFMGWLEVEELLNQYQTNDVLLHTAINDPFPNAVLEAMACGLIVIGSDSSGSVMERIDHRVNGVIHQTQNSESVFDSLSYLIERSDNEIKEIRQCAYETAHKWSVDYNVRIMTKVLFGK